MKVPTFTFLLVGMIVYIGCSSPTHPPQNAPEEEPKELSFERNTIADSVSFLWAHDPVDITGDGIVDLLFVDNNSYGGKLGYLEGQKEPGAWTEYIIDPENSGAKQFAMGDIEAADMDGDGDMDVVAAKHEGEWDNASSPSQVFWYENPSWEAHLIGEAPNFIKDVEITDFNGDGKMDLATLTFEESSLRIFQQESPDQWKLIQAYENYKNLHEGMDVGDLNGDGFSDIVACGHIFYSPGNDLTDTWNTENIDEQWNTQTGDWSRNGTKVFLQDIDGDQKCEVFISHSERAGFPVMMYKQLADVWQTQVIADSIPACHTLQVFDFDQDGDYDVLTGVNRSRAIGLAYTTFPVKIYLANESHSQWNPYTIVEDGIYNGQAADFEGDGDWDIFKYQTHDATSYELLENQLN
ncbi:MAG: VCBS repeat-containing protein [Bacteroidota bacterium]